LLHARFAPAGIVLGQPWMDRNLAAIPQVRSAPSLSRRRMSKSPLIAGLTARPPTFSASLREVKT
jgi:hypothetical protein